ncbi:hypothetical protein LUTEI9C_10249 [Luteimonas sp. 9C]|nr:hypothetical protein LUTEI9C_10249 [Luteimonas sp. 9C]
MATCFLLTRKTSVRDRRIECSQFFLFSDKTKITFIHAACMEQRVSGRFTDLGVPAAIGQC